MSENWNEKAERAVKKCDAIFEAACIVAAQAMMASDEVAAKALWEQHEILKKHHALAAAEFHAAIATKH